MIPLSARLSQGHVDDSAASGENDFEFQLLFKNEDLSLFNVVIKPPAAVFSIKTIHS